MNVCVCIYMCVCVYVCGGGGPEPIVTTRGQNITTDASEAHQQNFYDSDLDRLMDEHWL